MVEASGTTLLTVSAALALGALALAARFYGRGAGSGRAEQAFATGVLFLLGVYLPVHTLGWLQLLTRANLAWSAIALSMLALNVALVGVRAPLHFLRDALVRVLATPLAALRLTWRARSLIGVGLLLTMGVVLWTACLSYLAPATGWDGLWYHDSIVGFSIQNRGFAIEPLPPWHQMINGYARGSEYFNLFPVLLWDRRLIELAPSVFAAVALPGLYALFARLRLSSTLSIGLACSFVLLPALCLQLRSTYIDVQVAVAYLAALYFVGRPQLRVRDAVLATLSMALLCNAKSSGLPIAILMFCFFALRVALRWGRDRPARAAAGLLVSSLVVGLLGGATFARNYQLHQNPMYPLTVESRRLGIHWLGPAPVSLPDQRADLLEQLISPPSCGFEWPDTHTNGYGNGAPFIVLPGALLALTLLLSIWLRAFNRRQWPDSETLQVSGIVALTLAMAAITPTWTWARFNLHIVLGVFALFAWWLGRERRGQLGEGAVSALLCLSLVTVLWSRPGWSVTPELARELWRKSPAERASTRVLDFLPPEDVAAARDRELREGRTVAVDYGLDFLSEAWNEQLSNRVELVNVDDEKLYYPQLARADPDWIVVRPSTPLGKIIAGDTKSWQTVGPFRHDFVAYRRLRL